eukprot:CAMPEP_0182571132 /NCGR_PEP_ID=MMETSP1324-20130603/12240_1 /TAXON_ID=236786 /ORGANISM="Florenciella sp., Strain RCC1587" /LENGTH=220 /DNA_ID=CAMNT_0024785637 /DNA_START=111 /DNA_END=773 /DNA_ORIENTATION=+
MKLSLLIATSISMASAFTTSPSAVTTTRRARAMAMAPRVSMASDSDSSPSSPSSPVALTRRLLVRGVATIGGLALGRAKSAVAEDTLGFVTTPSGLKYYDVKEGPKEQQIAKSGDKVSIDYTGWLDDFDGKKFDSSLDRNIPLSLTLGSGQAILGLDEGLTGMRVGGTRRFVIKPELAYGGDGYPRSGDDKGSMIPGGSTLYFQVRLRSVKGLSGMGFFN